MKKFAKSGSTKGEKKGQFMVIINPKQGHSKGMSIFVLINMARE
jgi:hypothetical protein